MTKPLTKNESVLKATGKTWEEWLDILHNSRARTLSHADIARKLSEEYKVPGWWAQTITVEFERSIGRREVGQTCSGDFQASASRTLAGDMDKALADWEAYVKDLKEFGKIPFASEPSVSKTEKWRYWRVNLADGSKVNVVICNKENGKSHFAINHEKIGSKEEAEGWKIWWKGFLKQIL